MSVAARLRLGQPGLFPELFVTQVAVIERLFQLLFVPLRTPRGVDEDLIQPASQAVANAEKGAAAAAGGREVDRGAVAPPRGRLRRRAEQALEDRLLRLNVG